MVVSKQIPNILLILITSLMTSAVIGCDSGNDHLEYSQQAMERQARQNEAMSQQSQQVVSQSRELAEAAHDLVEQDAASRRELIQAQAQVQSQIDKARRRIDQQHRELDSEQREMARARVYEPVIAQAIITGALFLAALFPLIVTAYALRQVPAVSGSDEELLTHLLLQELAGQVPVRDDRNSPAPSLLDGSQPLLGPVASDSPNREPSL